MSKQKNSFIVENGVTLGVAVLALLVIFGVGLPRWMGDEAEAAHSGGPIELPASLSGGWKLDTSEQTAQSTDAQQTQMEDTLDAPTAIGQYRNANNLMIVQAVRAPGSAALTPTGAAYSKVDGAVCQTFQGQGSFSACSRSSDTLTVQVTSTSTDDAAKFAGELFDELG